MLAPLLFRGMARICAHQKHLFHLKDEESFWKLMKTVREEGSLNLEVNFLGFFKLVIPSGVGLFIWSIDRFSITVDIERWGVFHLCQLTLLSIGLWMIATTKDKSTIVILKFWWGKHFKTVESFWSLMNVTVSAELFPTCHPTQNGLRDHSSFGRFQSSVLFEMWLKLSYFLVCYVHPKGNLSIPELIWASQM